MINWKRTRNWKNATELEADIQKFFDNNDHYSIEWLYLHIGITKYDYNNWKDSTTNKKFNKWAAIILEAKLAIKNNLAHEMTNEENSTRLKARTMYMRSRYKDNWEAEEVKDTSDSKITINLVNEGNNAIK